MNQEQGMNQEQDLLRQLLGKDLDRAALAALKLGDISPYDSEEVVFRLVQRLNQANQKWLDENDGTLIMVGKCCLLTLRKFPGYASQSYVIQSLLNSFPLKENGPTPLYYDTLEVFKTIGVSLGNEPCICSILANRIDQFNSRLSNGTLDLKAFSSLDLKELSLLLDVVSEMEYVSNNTVLLMSLISLATDIIDSWLWGGDTKFFYLSKVISTLKEIVK